VAATTGRPVKARDPSANVLVRPGRNVANIACTAKSWNLAAQRAPEQGISRSPSDWSQEYPRMLLTRCCDSLYSTDSSTRWVGSESLQTPARVLLRRPSGTDITNDRSDVAYTAPCIGHEHDAEFDGNSPPICCDGWHCQ
jgi:hypothetical protein